MYSGGSTDPQITYKDPETGNSINPTTGTVSGVPPSKSPDKDGNPFDVEVDHFAHLSPISNDSALDLMHSNSLVEKQRVRGATANASLSIPEVSAAKTFHEYATDYPEQISDHTKSTPALPGGPRLPADRDAQLLSDDFLERLREIRRKVPDEIKKQMNIAGQIAFYRNKLLRIQHALHKVRDLDEEYKERGMLQTFGLTEKDIKNGKFSTVL